MLKKIIITIILTSLSLYSEALEVKNNYDDFEFNARGRTRSGSVSKTSSSKDTYKYFFKSLLLPGWGEYELGYKNGTKFFAITEIGLIASALGFYLYSDSKTDEYKDFARTHAGIPSGSIHDGYWINIGNYNNIDEYNTEKTRIGQADLRYDSNMAWHWDSESSRKRYDKIRISAASSEDYTYYLIGGVLLNHLISGINASYLAGNMESSISPTLDSKNEPAAKLSINYGF
ncbi:MAG: hypothetical protein JXR48_13085 [Candidatus Delongbacteria bacterium]|nr:hypothetical protein [Candidatus Delongbacteria bacterium]MBN2835888.1 hypothetical protein [Candidatus Delongbacteria bacterium]